MKFLPSQIDELIEDLSLLPGVGPKSAARMALFLQKAPQGVSRNLAEKILTARKNVSTCSMCFGLSEKDICPICSSNERRKDVVMVVEDSFDLVAIEEAGVFDGRYHVLGGLISPMRGVSVDELRVGELLERIRKISISEVVFALNTDMEGESTILYISGLLKKNGYGGIISRLARGISRGVDLDYLDKSTLGSAFVARVDVS